MCYDYDAAATKLDEFRTDCESTAEAADAAGRRDIADIKRRSAEGFARLAEKMRAARDGQSP